MSDKNYNFASRLFFVSEVFEKPVNSDLVYHHDKSGFFLTCSMVSNLLVQLQIYWQIYMIYLVGVLTGLELFK